MKIQSWRTAQRLITPRSTRRPRQTTNCGKFSRTCQRNTGRLSTVTVSSRNSIVGCCESLPCRQPKGNSCPCKVGSKNRRIIWSGSRKRLNRGKRNVWKSCKKWIEADQELEAANAKQIQAKYEMAMFVAEQTAENAKTVNQGIQFFRHTSGSISDQAAQHRSLSVQIRSLDAKHGVPRCFGTAHGGLAQPRSMSRKSARLWHRQCGHWRQGSRHLNLVPRRTASRARTKSYPMEYAYLDFAKWAPKDKKPSRGACQTPSQKRGDWRRNANRKEKVCSLLRLWI